MEEYVKFLQEWSKGNWIWNSCS